MAVELDIAILKHTALGEADSVLLETIRARGHRGRVIDPRAGVHELDWRDRPHIVIGRCELSSFRDSALSAYLSTFARCRALGVGIVNGPEFMLAAQDKFASHLALERELRGRGLESINPETMLCFCAEEAEAAALSMIDRHGAVVLKRPQAGWGAGVFLAATAQELRTLLGECFVTGDPILLQRPISKPRNADGGFRDLRVWACRTPAGAVETVAAFYRNGSPGEFKTNGSRGGAITVLGAGPEIDPQLANWASRVMDALGGDVAGLDFITDEDGRYWFLEVNYAFEAHRNSSFARFGPVIWDRAIDLAESRAARQGHPAR